MGQLWLTIQELLISFFCYYHNFCPGLLANKCNNNRLNGVTLVTSKKQQIIIKDNWGLPIIGRCLPGLATKTKSKYFGKKKTWKESLIFSLEPYCIHDYNLYNDIRAAYFILSNLVDLTIQKLYK